MVFAVIMPSHPSVSALYDALLREDWEALAVLASEGVATHAPSVVTMARLTGFGIISDGLLTATGYALLLAWHRRHLRMTWSERWKATPDAIAHFNRMRLLLDDAAGLDVEHPSQR